MANKRHLELLKLRGELENMDFRKAQLVKIKLNGVKIIKSDFRGANLHGANFFKSYLEENNFKEAKLNGVCFNNAQLINSKFDYTLCKKANFNDAQAPGATFIKSELQGAKFRNANLTGACFVGANLQNAEFTGAILKKVTFTEAKFEGAVFCQIENDGWIIGGVENEYVFEDEERKKRVKLHDVGLTEPKIFLSYAREDEGRVELYI